MIGLVLVVVIVYATQGFCAEEIVQQVSDATSKSTFSQAAFKFLKAMGGVALSSFIIFAGLTLYNNFFVKSGLDGNSEDDVLKTPRSSDEALTFFIKKNKIR